jgi:Ras-related protein Rab-33B
MNLQQHCENLRSHGVFYFMNKPECVFYSRHISLYCMVVYVCSVMLQSLPQWIEECDYHNLTRDVPRILVGNKCDCKENQVVKTNAAQRFADFHNMPVSFS